VNFGNFFTWLDHKFYSFTFLFMDSFFTYLLFYVAISWSGCFIDPIWYSFTFIDVLVRFKVVRTLFLSVTLNGDQLIATVMLILIVLYIYAVIGFFYF